MPSTNIWECPPRAPPPPIKLDLDSKDTIVEQEDAIETAVVEENYLLQEIQTQPSPTENHTGSVESARKDTETENGDVPQNGEGAKEKEQSEDEDNIFISCVSEMDTNTQTPENSSSDIGAAAKCIHDLFAGSADSNDFRNAMITLVQGMEQTLVEQDDMVGRIRAENEKTMKKITDEYKVYIAQLREEHKHAAERLDAELSDKTKDLTYFMDQNNILNNTIKLMRATYEPKLRQPGKEQQKPPRQQLQQQEQQQQQQ